MDNSNTPSPPTEHYYVPVKSYWPFMGSIGLGTTVVGGVGIFHAKAYGWPIFFVGALIMAGMLFGWFSHVIEESQKGLYSRQMDRSFRWGMAWFIFSEVMFFGAFFGTLFYARHFSIPWLGGLAEKISSPAFDTHHVLWPNFHAVWPLLQNPNPELFKGPTAAMDALGLPAINTLILLISGVTVTWAHYGLKAGNRKQLLWGLLVTVLLGATFLCLQAFEYHHAYHELGLTLNSGMYGTTFFMLTGFHGAHVCIGTIMLLIMLLRACKGHFMQGSHFAFEATAWYWHFVDVVWLLLFTFVYWL